MYMLILMLMSHGHVNGYPTGIIKEPIEVFSGEKALQACLNRKWSIIEDLEMSRKLGKNNGITVNVGNHVMDCAKVPK